ncbi:hypothetical protein [Streptomyces sp. NPDC048340]|uniref:hypothetical protein n=1 Tax=Streptomyces sp. NPDC048340 TaxID=3365537 RepID=UPI00371749EF
MSDNSKYPSLHGLTEKDLSACSKEELHTFLLGVRRYRKELVLLHQKSVDLYEGTKIARRVSSWLVVFMIPTLLGGIYAANFYQPENRFVWAWPAFLLLVLASGVAMFAHLRRKGCL